LRIHITSFYNANLAPTERLLATLSTNNSTGITVLFVNIPGASQR